MDRRIFRPSWVPEHSDSDVRVAAVTAMCAVGDDCARRQVAVAIETLANTSSPDRLILAARMLGACTPGTWIDRRLLALHAGRPRS